MQAGSLQKYLAGSALCAGRRVGNDANDVGNDANETCIGVATSAIACSALLAVLFGAAFFKAPSVTLVPEPEFAASDSFPGQIQGQPALLKPRQTAALEVGTLVVSKISDFGDSEITTQGPRGSRKGAPEALSSTQAELREPSNVLASRAVSYTHLTLPTTPYV